MTAMARDLGLPADEIEQRSGMSIARPDGSMKQLLERFKRAGRTERVGSARSLLPEP